MSERERISEVVLDDDRGRKVAAQFGERVKRDSRLGEVRQELWTSTPWGGFRMLLAASSGMIAATLYGIVRRPNGQSVNSGMIILGCMMVGCSAYWFLRLRQMRGSLTARLIQEGRIARKCPACCYDLRECVAAGDGCTVCPECGGAWNLDAQNESKAG